MLNDNTPIFQFAGPLGIPVQIGGSIILLPLLFVSFSGGSTTLMYDLTFVGLLIGSIFLHELGHAWGYRVQGVRVHLQMLRLNG